MHSMPLRLLLLLLDLSLGSVRLGQGRCLGQGVSPIVRLCILCTCPLICPIIHPSIESLIHLPDHPSIQSSVCLVIPPFILSVSQSVSHIVHIPVLSAHQQYLSTLLRRLPACSLDFSA